MGVRWLLLRGTGILLTCFSYARLLRFFLVVGEGLFRLIITPLRNRVQHSGSVWHLHHLRRGRTSAVAEGVDWAQDGRRLAIWTRNRTVHALLVN
ncbi:hypothetical protein K443DRAFT_428389 [Laccaria amethystina LaAM-08-1]|uniref:Unplaced genomic scaffold K443scaffold_360, whole genome shotgun sequence n=1 Tax=Laccaria amethystina LaAM-08-1 TaxID=1095629 RepID=A0A0C9WVC7_9AGAR|nr:hypothetical protein K443DRAFT_428389 [Laccaria amethystina LaAM-08-1]